MELKSEGSKKRRSKERRSNGATNDQSDGATDGQSDRANNDRAISLYIKIETIKTKRCNCVGNYGWSERATE